MLWRQPSKPQEVKTHTTRECEGGIQIVKASTLFLKIFYTAGRSTCIGSLSPAASGASLAGCRGACGGCKSNIALRIWTGQGWYIPSSVSFIL